MTSSKHGGATSHDPLACAVEVSFTEDCLVTRLEDGRVLSVPLEWYPSLRDATEQQRSNWQLIGGGIGIHWPELDEDLSVRGMLSPGSSFPRPKAG